MDVVIPLLHIYSEPAECIRNHAQVRVRHILDCDGAPVHGRHAYEAADFDHVRKEGMLRSREAWHTVYPKKIRADAVNLRPHPDEHAGKLLDIRLAGSIVYCRSAFGKDCSHKDVGRACHRRLIQQHIPALKTPALRKIQIERPPVRIVFEFCPEVEHSRYMGIHPAAADLVSTGFREPCVPETGEKRPHNHQRSPERSAFAHEILAFYIFFVDIVGPEGIFALLYPAHLHSHAFEKKDEVAYVKDFGHIGYGHFFRSEKNGADDFKGFVLGSLGPDGATELMSAFNYK